jgi:hypothetical protein
MKRWLFSVRLSMACRVVCDGADTGRYDSLLQSQLEGYPETVLGLET